MTKGKWYVTGFVLLILFSLLEDAEHKPTVLTQPGISAFYDQVVEEDQNHLQDAIGQASRIAMVLPLWERETRIIDSLVDTNRRFLTSVFYQSSYVGL